MSEVQPEAGVDFLADPHRFAAGRWEHLDDDGEWVWCRDPSHPRYPALHPAHPDYREEWKP